MNNTSTFTPFLTKRQQKNTINVYNVNQPKNFNNANASKYISAQNNAKQNINNIKKYANLFKNKIQLQQILSVCMMLTRENTNFKILKMEEKQGFRIWVIHAI